MRLHPRIDPIRRTLRLALLLITLPACASAFELRLEQTSPGGVAPPGGVGSIVTFDLVIRHEADELYFDLLSVGMSWDPTVIAYRPDLSDSNDYYPLYSPTSGCKACSGATWHMPVADPPVLHSTAPPGRSQLNVEFENFVMQQPEAETFGWFDVWPVEEEWLATLAFELVGPGSWTDGFRFDLEHDGNGVTKVYHRDPPLDMTDQFTTSILLTPEPSTLLLVATGVGLLGVRARERQR